MSNSPYKAEPSGFRPHTNPVRIRIISLAVGVVLIAGTGYFLLKGSQQPTSDTLDGASITGQNPLESQRNGNQPSSQDPASTKPSPAGSVFAHVYRHPSLGFSFEYPAGFSLTSFPTDQGEVVLVEKSGGEWFQVSIDPFDEEGPITAARIRQDLPKMLIENPQQVEIAGGKALVFFSKKATSAKTREAWFIWPESPLPHGNYLFQASGYADFDATLSQIMATWTFQ